jgi:hypothetical protein
LTQRTLDDAFKRILEKLDNQNELLALDILIKLDTQEEEK